jgi:N-acetylmuramoyl-L-alanine amidase
VAPAGLPLAVGDRGEAVSDIQHRLAALAHTSVPIDADGVFGAGTRAAVEAFQHQRGLRVDGVCGVQTWTTLVEAGFHLGDRFLYRRTPMLRGDDVADLQQRLCTLGFDTGRVDGIFGDGTSRALAEFQRNAGLPVDAIVGEATLRELIRLESRHADPELVSSVRARAQLRDAGPTLSGRHVAIGESGGLGSVTGAMRRRLVLAGTMVTELHHPDDSTQALQANELAVDVFVGLRLNPDAAACRTAFWSGTHEASPGGRLLAELVQRAVPVALGIADGGAHGMALPLLRETRMPAVLIEVGPASLVVERAAALAGALTHVLSEWAGASQD